ncbi:MAG: TldD/PmbA family protein [Deltaproteobacteria bacterium]|nr:MAG: TldD/PmbA family protein [Deltaproteobacteria bacterium]
MLGQKGAETVCKDVLTRAGTDQVEVLFMVEDQSLTRFANNTIHQNVAERNGRLMVRVLQGKRIGLATSNRMDRDGLDALVENGRTNAEASAEDPDYPGLPEPTEYSAIEAFDQATADFSPEARARAVAQVCRLSGEKGLNGSGTFSTGTSEVAVANSQGVFAYHISTNADFQTVVMSGDSSGREQGSGWRVADIPVEFLGETAIQKAEVGRSPGKIDAGEYPVVLTPYATEDLLNMLNYYGMGAQTLLEGRSWMSDRLGERVMSGLIDIWDDGLDPNGVPMPFDYEGVPKRRVDIVQKGKVNGPVYDRITGGKMGKTTTGHAPPATMRSLGPMATNLFMARGTASTDELIRSTDRGLFVSRFWYTRLVHPRDCVITGMTRDGVFLIKDGELTYPIKDLRFTQSYVEALANVEMVGSETRLLVSEFGGYATRIPALKIGKFNFTGSTV